MKQMPLQKNFFFYIILVIGLLISCQNNQVYQPIDNSTKNVGSTKEHPLPQTPPPPTTIANTRKPTHTPTITITANELTLTRVIIKQTEEAAFQTRWAGVPLTVEAAYKTLPAKNVGCTPGYHYAPYFGELLSTDSYHTNTTTWTVIHCMPDDSNSDNTGYSQIINRDNSKFYTIQYVDIPMWKYFYLEVEEVDADRELMYFTPTLDAEADGFFGSYYFGTGNAIFQLNLKTGEFIPILPMEVDYCYHDIGLSADSKILAVSSSEHPNEFRLMQLVDGQTFQTITLDKDISIIGSFTFSHENQYLIYAAGHEGWNEVKNGISIYRLNLQTMENMELVHNDERLMLPRHIPYFYASYFYGNTVTLGSVHFMNEYNPYEGYLWELDILTGEVTEISTTDGW